MRNNIKLRWSVVFFTSLLMLVPHLAHTQKMGYMLYDSLIKELPKQRNDTAKVLFLNKLCALVPNEKKKVGFAQQALTLSKELHWERGVALTALSRGCFDYNAQPDSLFVVLQGALSYFQKAKDSFLIAKTFTTIARVHLWYEDYAKAMPFLEKASSFYDKWGISSEKAQNLELIGLSQYIAKHNTDAIKSFRKAMAMKQLCEIKPQNSYSLIILGDIYSDFGQYDSAMMYYFKGLRSAEETADKREEGLAHMSIGFIYYKEYKYSLIEKHYKLAENIFEENANQQELVMIYENWGHYYEDINNNLLAERYYLKDLKLSSCLRDKNELLDAYTMLAYFYTGVGKYELANDYTKKALRIEKEPNFYDYSSYSYDSLGDYYDSLASHCLKGSESWSNNLKRGESYRKKAIETCIGIGKKEYEMALYKYLATNLKTQGKYGEALKAYETYMALKDSIFNESQSQEIVRVEMRYAMDKQKDSMQYVNNLAKAELATLTKERELEQLQNRQYWGFGLLVVCLLGLGGGLLYYQKANEAKLLKERKALDEAVLRAKLSEVRLNALGKQMNPHFVFNCLNSIRFYTEENNVDAASDYLIKFSKLIRGTLDMARKDTVALEDDIEFNRIFLELEAMRFKDKLHYSIEVDKAIDTNLIEIPPLLIQPYIENAIWHGLMNKPEGGSVWLRFGLENERFRIEIEDDGVGRAKSNALKQHRPGHQSHGMSVSAERIKLIDGEVKVEDLLDDRGFGCGTRVVIVVGW